MKAKRSAFLCWAAAGLLCCCGVFLLTALSGHGVLGLLCLFAAALLVFDRLTAAPARTHRGWRTARIAVAVCLLAAVLPAAVTGGMILSASRGDGADCAYIVVLGAGVDGTRPSLSLRERIDAAAAYLNSHPKTVAVLSGGQGTNEEITEAACMQRELLARGVDADRLWLEEHAKNTRENLAFSLDLIAARTGERPASLGIVSADYHLFRAELFAQEQGVTPHGISAHTTWPSLWLNYFLREIAAVWAHWAFG